MFQNVKQEAEQVLGGVSCARCEHHAPGFCDQCPNKPADPWWPRQDVKEAKVNIASGEDAYVF